MAEQRFAFTAPISRALMGKRVGERVNLVLGSVPQELEVLTIGWPNERQ